MHKWLLFDTDNNNVRRLLRILGEKKKKLSIFEALSTAYTIHIHSTCSISEQITYGMGPIICMKHGYKIDSINKQVPNYIFHKQVIPFKINHHFFALFAVLSTKYIILFKFPTLNLSVSVCLWNVYAPTLDWISKFELFSWHFLANKIFWNS